MSNYFQKPFAIPNPQDFKLRIVWSIDAINKMVAEFSSSNWLPRIGETLVLPVDELGKRNSCRTWHKFKVFDIIYDFQHQTVRVLCSPTSPSTPRSSAPVAREAMSRFKEVEDKVQAQMEAMEARWKAEAIERQAQLEYEFSLIEESADEELAKLKAEFLLKQQPNVSTND